MGRRRFYVSFLFFRSLFVWSGGASTSSFIHSPSPTKLGNNDLLAAFERQTCRLSHFFLLFCDRALSLSLLSRFDNAMGKGKGKEGRANSVRRAP